MTTTLASNMEPEQADNHVLPYFCAQCTNEIKDLYHNKPQQTLLSNCNQLYNQDGRPPGKHTAAELYGKDGCYLCIKIGQYAGTSRTQYPPRARIQPANDDSQWRVQFLIPGLPKQGENETFVNFYLGVLWDWNQSCFQLREITESMLEPEGLRLMIETCLKTEKPLAITSMSLYPAVFRLIDVRKRSVIKVGSEPPPYIAVSYRWEPNPDLTLLTENDKSLAHPNSLTHTRIAGALSQCIDLCVEMGYYYLWIDRFCIVQNDPSDQRQQIPFMGQIYRGAVATLVICPEDDKGQYLPRYRQPSRHNEMISKPNFGNRLHNVPWRTRGWTFQEEILSRRRIYFLEYSTKYVCLCHQNTEISTLSYFRDPLMELGHSEVSFGLDTEDFEPLTYRRTVLEYTGRNLTLHTDRLAAFMGLLEKYSVKGLYGLPSPQLVLYAITWYQHPEYIRSMVTADETLPSWSWTRQLYKVDYHVDFDLFHRDLNDIYQPMAASLWCVGADGSILAGHRRREERIPPSKAINYEGIARLYRWKSSMTNTGLPKGRFLNWKVRQLLSNHDGYLVIHGLTRVISGRRLYQSCWGDVDDGATTVSLDVSPTMGNIPLKISTESLKTENLVYVHLLQMRNRGWGLLLRKVEGPVNPEHRDVSLQVYKRVGLVDIEGYHPVKFHGSCIVRRITSRRCLLHKTVAMNSRIHRQVDPTHIMRVYIMRICKLLGIPSQKDFQVNTQQYPKPHGLNPRSHITRYKNPKSPPIHNLCNRHATAILGQREARCRHGMAMAARRKWEPRIIIIR